jgi:hypothetical protein
MVARSNNEISQVAHEGSANVERVRSGLAYTDYSKSPIVRATWYALTPEVRALLNAFGAQHDDHEDTSHMLAEVQAIEATHPYVKASERLHVNTSGDHERGIWIFHFGAYGCTHVLAFGCLEDALEDAAETLKKVAPRHFCDEAVNEAYNEAYESAIAAGKDEDEAQQEGWDASAEDVTYTESGYLASHEWNVSELQDLSEVVDFILAGV